MLMRNYITVMFSVPPSFIEQLWQEVTGNYQGNIAPSNT